MKFTDYDTRIAGYAVVLDAEDRILLSWYNGGGRDEPGWMLPGGGVEYAETIEAAIVREVREETGYDVALDWPLVTHSVTWDSRPDSPRPYKSVRIIYSAHVCGGSLGTLEVGGTTDHAAWMLLSDVPLTNARAEIVDIGVAAFQRARER